jgi:hypothetical protein
MFNLSSFDGLVIHLHPSGFSASVPCPPASDRGRRVPPAPPALRRLASTPRPGLRLGARRTARAWSGVLAACAVVLWFVARPDGDAHAATQAAPAAEATQRPAPALERAADPAPARATAGPRAVRQPAGLPARPEATPSSRPLPRPAPEPADEQEPWRHQGVGSAFPVPSPAQSLGMRVARAA